MYLWDHLHGKPCGIRPRRRPHAGLGIRGSLRGGGPGAGVPPCPRRGQLWGVPFYSSFGLGLVPGLVHGFSISLLSNLAQEGGNYVFGGESAQDFVLEGGRYSLCWCSNMHNQTCKGSDTFIMHAGQLTVIGPFRNNTIRCVRGQDCRGHTLAGVELFQGRRVALRMSECSAGNSSDVQLSPANENGIASLEQDFSNSFNIDFGQSHSEEDHTLSLNVRDVGYDLCWCGQRSCLEADFVVPAGTLYVQGPPTNQEVSCFVGQPCLLNQTGTGIEFDSIGTKKFDRIMVLSACGDGDPIAGVPGNSTAECNEATCLSTNTSLCCSLQKLINA